MTESVAVVPAVREVIAKEYADGDLAVRFLVAADYVAAFWQFFPDVETGAFVATEDGAVPVIRAGVMGEKADGSIRVRLKVEARHKAQFRELLPRPGAECFLAAEDPVCTKSRMMDDAEAVFGQLARQLRTHIPFMLNPAVWKAVGTEAQYREFLYQRSCVACGWKPYQSMDDWIHCEAAHVRRADDSGTAFKPPYKMIPLCPNTPGRQGSCH